MNASKLNKNLRLAIVAILTSCLLIATIGGFFIWKKGEVLKFALAEEKEKRNRLEYLSAVAERYSEEKAAEDVITDALPTSAEISNFLIELSAFGQKTGAFINKVDFPANLKKEKISNFQTKIELSASSVAPIEAIVKRIEANRRIIDITDLQINVNGSDTKAIISLKTYYKNNEKK